MRALRNWKRFEPGSDLKSWLATIAVRLCRDRLRRRQARQRLQGILENLHLASQPPSPEEVLISGESRRTLWAAVQALDEKHRLPLVLRYVNGMTASEIALALDLPEGTVHSRLHHAILKLGSRLEGWKGDER